METTPNASHPIPTPRYDCLVISDLHLGSDVCQAKLLEEFLDWAVENCDELVINGDVFDDLNFKRLTKRHFACLKVISEIPTEMIFAWSGFGAIMMDRSTSSVTSSASKSLMNTCMTTASSSS